MDAESKPRHLGVEFAISLFAYGAICVVCFDPLFRNPGSTMMDPGHQWLETDVNLIMWILSWCWHALTREPARLFDANIFYPAPLTFAGSEHMLGYAPIFGPVYELTGNPLLANNVTILACFAFAGGGMFALLRHWRVPLPGAFFGGFVHAFFPARVGGLWELQILLTGLLPLSLIFFDRAVVGGRVGAALSFAGLFLWQMFCSVYLAFMALAGLASYAVVSAAKVGRRLNPRGCLAVGVFLLLGAAFFVWFHRPYAELRASGVIPDYGIGGQMAVYSNGWLKEYFTPPGLVRIGVAGFVGERVWYLGLLPSISMLGLFLPRTRAQPAWAVAGALSIALAGYVLGLGPAKAILGESWRLPYSYLADFVPGFSSMRVPGRFGLLLMTGVAAMTGIGFGRLVDRLGLLRKSLPARVAVTALAVVGVALEYDLHAVKVQTRARAGVLAQLPPLQQKLATLPRGPVVDVPVRRTALRHDRDTTRAMYYSTFHWQPLLLGYSGYAPPSAALVEALAARLPEPRAIELLCRMTGVKYVVAHLARMDEAERESWQSAPRLRRIGRGAKAALFETDEDCVGDWVEKVRAAGEWQETLEGSPFLSLPRGEIANLRLVSEVPSSTIVFRQITVEVEVRNTTEMTWPVLAPMGTPVVSLGYRWEQEDGSIVWPLREDQPRAALLPYDIEPGAQLRVTLPIRSPVRPGPSWLVVGLAQGGDWLDSRLDRVRVEVVAAGAGD